MVLPGPAPVPCCVQQHLYGACLEAHAAMQLHACSAPRLCIHSGMWRVGPKEASTAEHQHVADLR